MFCLMKRCDFGLPIKGEIKGRSRVAARPQGMNDKTGQSDDPRRQLTSLLGVNKRHIDQMFAHEPNLQLIRPNHVADQQVVGAVVAQIGRFLRELA